MRDLDVRVANKYFFTHDPKCFGATRSAGALLGAAICFETADQRPLMGTPRPSRSHPGVGLVCRVTERTGVPSPCGPYTALQCSKTARRVAHVRASFDDGARLGTFGAAREGARRSSNSVTVSVERVVSLNGRLSRHRVVRVQRLNA